MVTDIQKQDYIEVEDFDKRLEEAERELLRLPQVDCPVQHHFSDGIYCREMLAPAGTALIGHEHKEECLNVLMMGKIAVKVGNEVKHLEAPCIFKSAPGVKKLGLVIRNVIWLNIHPNPDNTTDMKILEDRHINKSQARLEYDAEQELLAETKEDTDGVG